jgi:hypothetical protein
MAKEWNGRIMKIPCKDCLILPQCKNINVLTFFSRLLPSCSIIRDYLDITSYTSTMCYHGSNTTKAQGKKRFKEVEELFKIKFIGD